MTRDEDATSPIRIRSDLVDILKRNPKNTEAIVAVIESELRGIKDSQSRSQVSTALSKAAKRASVGKNVVDNVLHWLAETSPDVRQMILVRTIEDLLQDSQSRSSALAALARVSSEENVKTVMEWVKRGVMTTNQAVYVLLYPESSSVLK